jgi:hypothetical protein
MSKTNTLIAALDRHARRIGLALMERGNVRGFEYGPTRRWLEFRPGGKGIVKVTAYSRRDGGVVEAEQYKTQPQMEALMVRALDPFTE